MSLEDCDRDDSYEENPRDQAKYFFRLLKKGGLEEEEARYYGLFVQVAINAGQISWSDLGNDLDQDKFEMICLKSVPGKYEYYCACSSSHEI